MIKILFKVEAQKKLNVINMNSSVYSGAFISIFTLGSLVNNL